MDLMSLGHEVAVAIVMIRPTRVASSHTVPPAQCN